jgi:hypothetical protein
LDKVLVALQAQADASQAISGTTVTKSAFEQVETGRTDGPAPQVGPGRTQRYSYGSADAVDSLLTIGYCDADSLAAAFR